VNIRTFKTIDGNEAVARVAYALKGMVAIYPDHALAGAGMKNLWALRHRLKSSAGADVAMLCSLLMRRGIDHIRVLEQEVENWTREHEQGSAEQLSAGVTRTVQTRAQSRERSAFTSPRK
jgi:hypothetical protein